MNWYQIFYWVTVADGIKDFFDVFSNIFTWFGAIGIIITGLLIAIYLALRAEGNVDTEEEQGFKFWIKTARSFSIWMWILATITWAGYVFTPTKKDAMIIIAGGTVGQFITSDSSAKQIPAEVMSLLRNKIREMNEVSISDPVKDSLADMTKEQLIELVRKKDLE